MTNRGDRAAAYVFLRGNEAPKPDVARWIEAGSPARAPSDVRHLADLFAIRRSDAIRECAALEVTTTVTDPQEEITRADVVRCCDSAVKAYRDAMLALLEKP